MATLEESLRALQANPSDKDARNNIRMLVDKRPDGVADRTEVGELAEALTKIFAEMSPEKKSNVIESLELNERRASEFRTMSAEDREKLITVLGKEKFEKYQAIVTGKELREDPVTGLMFTPEAEKIVVKAVLDGANSPDFIPTPATPLSNDNTTPKGQRLGKDAGRS